MIFTESLQKRAPFATKFFSKALNSRQNRFANGFILSGNDITLQYELVLEIARYLNCTSIRSNDCNCINCCWIKQNAHPAVITISPIDYTEKEQNTISIGQIRTLKNALGISSPYFRVVIFTNAKESKELTILPFAPPKKPNELTRAWIPEAINQKIFGASPSNALLKTLEEPSDNVVFFFLTKNKNDLLSTIISRCQCINILSTTKVIDDYSSVESFFKKMPLKSERACLECISEFEEISKEIPKEVLLNQMENYCKKLLEKNALNPITTRHIINTINKIETTKNQLKNFVKEQNAIETLFFSLKN